MYHADEHKAAGQCADLQEADGIEFGMHAHDHSCACMMGKCGAHLEEMRHSTEAHIVAAKEGSSTVEDKSRIMLVPAQELGIRETQPHGYKYRSSTSANVSTTVAC